MGNVIFQIAARVCAGQIYLLNISQFNTVPQARTDSTVLRISVLNGKLSKMPPISANLPHSAPFAPPQTVKPPRFRMARVVAALVLRETGARDSRASLGFLWNVIEPVVSIVILSLMFSLISRSPRFSAVLRDRCRTVFAVYVDQQAGCRLDAVFAQLAGVTVCHGD